MPEKKSSGRPDYAGSNQDDIGRPIRIALAEHQEGKLTHLIDDSCEKVVRALFQEAQKRVMDNVNTDIYEGIEQAAIEACSAGVGRAAVELLTRRCTDLPSHHTLNRISPASLLDRHLSQCS